MFRKLFLMASAVLVLSLAGPAAAIGPSGWFDEDINTTGGSAEESDGTFSVSGDGADIWGTADAFHYTYKLLEGDGEMVARVVSNGSGSNAWAKGGVMIREELTPGSTHAMAVVTGGEGGGAAFQWRPDTDGDSLSAHGPSPTVSPPHWVRIVREGNTFSGFLSPDGTNWTQQGTDTDINMGDSVYIGLCVTSHAGGEIRTYEFDSVSWIGNTTDAPPQLTAYEPSPADGALHPETWVSTGWQPGETAVSHDVYFSDVLADVEAGAEEAFIGNQSTPSFIVGFTGFAYPDGLVPGTTYYWRVDEVEADGTTHTGDIWSFSVPPRTAYAPDPGDGAIFVPEDVTLSWEPGFNAKLHTVYFGDDFDTVANATGGDPIGNTTFQPGALELNKTYYWRVDEFDPPTTHTGEVWSFTTTLPGLGTGVMSRWEDLSGTDINALKDSVNYPDDPDVTEEIDEFQWNGQDLDNYGGQLEAWVYVPATGDYTFWLCTDDQGELWLSSNDDPSNTSLVASIPSWASVDEWTKFPSQKSEPVPLVGGEKYYIMAIWKEGGGGDHCQVAWQGPGIPERTIIPGSNLSPFEPVKAFGANPANGAVDVKQTPTLKWKPGIHAESHEVYFGSDEAAVAGATKASPEYKGSQALGEESFEPGTLAWDSTFYWRVDEVATGDPNSPWVGSVWNFTTADFLVVDNFEDYTDNDAEGEAVWQTWLDGFGVDTNGSQIGNAVPPYMELNTVQQGRQSVELFYNNTGGVTNSEVERPLELVRDWTQNGVDELLLWFHGRPASDGSFVEGPVGTFTMTGSGADITGDSDEFHYAYKTLTGAGSIIARVNSVEDTHAWAKAGVMIRGSLDADAQHAMTFITPDNGAVFEYRLDVGGDNVGAAGQEADVTAPHWVKIERDIGGNFSASHSADGSSWQPLGLSENIQMGSTVFIGLALTSHDAAATTEAVFSNVTITGNVTGQWTNQDIGIASNAAEPLYVGIANAAGAPAIVPHPDPLAAQIDEWTPWPVPLSEFEAQGIDLTDVRKLVIGLGAKGGAASGGSGSIFLDNITVRKPEPEPQQ